MLFRARTKVLIAYATFMVLNLIYLFEFSMNWEEWYAGLENTLFSYPLNLDQGKAYVPDLILLIDGASLPINTSTGISYFYYFLHEIYPYDVENIAVVSFVVNNIFILISYLYLIKIGGEVLGLRMKHRWLFFLNPSLIYVSQLMNKESIGLAVVPLTIYLLAKNKIGPSILTAIFAGLIRLHHGLLWIFSYFLVRNPLHYFAKLAIVYIVLSLGNAFFLIVPEREEQLFYADSYGLGFSELIFIVNRDYYIGSLLLNPIKLMQYFYDLFLSVLFIDDHGRIILYNVHNIPFLAALIFFYKELINLFWNLSNISRGPAKEVLAVIIIFLLLLTLSPLVHSRYLFPITCPLILLLIFIRSRHANRVATGRSASSLTPARCLSSSHE